MRRRDEERRSRITPRATMLLFVTGTVLVGALFVAADERARTLYPAGFLATQLGTAALIVAAVGPGRPARILSQPALRWAGVRSYGIYLEPSEQSTLQTKTITPSDAPPTIAPADEQPPDDASPPRERVHWLCP